jgi:peptide/nickel transport system substrate-binding protein
MSNFRFRPLVAAIAIVAFAAVACTSGSKKTPSNGTSGSGTGSIVKGGDLTFAIPAYPLNMDPYSPSVDIAALQIFDAWWEYLVRPSPDGSAFEPMLAASYTVSPDLKTYTFKLRPNVKFSDGTPLTTDDVVSSLHNAFTMKGSQIAFLGDKIASITAPDSSTVVVQLSSPWRYLLSDLSGFNAAILPKALIEKEGYDNFLKHPVGTGPFELKSLDPGNSVTLVRNPNYWQPGRPYLDSITLKVVRSDVARATAVTGGQADIAQDPPPNQLAALKTNNSIRVLSFPLSQVETIDFNVKNPPFGNLKLRQAISLAIDRNAIVQAGLFGAGTVATTFLVGPPAQTLQNTSLNLYPYDPTRARQLVQESGLPAPITIPLQLSQGAVQDAIAAVVQQNLAAVGIKVNIVRNDYSAIQSSVSSGNYSAASRNWSDYIGDPSEQPLFWMDPAFCCHSNWTNYEDPAAIALAHKAVEASDPAEAQRLFDDVQRSVATSAHAIPLYYPDQVYVTTDKVKGFLANPFGYWYFDEVGFVK